MKIQIHDIPLDGLDLDLDQDSEDLAPVLKDLTEDGTVPAMRCHLHLTRDETIVTVEGQLAGDLAQSCSRCLEPVPLRVDEKFKFYLRPPLAESEQLEGDEVELNEGALDYGFIEGNVVDVPSLVQEQILLALPSQPLCKPDCKGICQQCGADLNREACQCAGRPVDPRFAMLKQLKVPQK